MIEIHRLFQFLLERERERIEYGWEPPKTKKSMYGLSRKEYGWEPPKTNA